MTSTPRPAVGVTPDWCQPADRPHARYELQQYYPDAVLAAGGLPLVLPYARDAAAIDAYLARIDGLLLTGGAFDVPPESYGEARRPCCGPLKAERTDFERALLVGALERGLPVLGICGGMQLIDVAFGGALYQDLPTDLPEAIAHQQRTDKREPAHTVAVRAGTRLAQAVGAGELQVNSTHHQAVRTVGGGLVASAVAPDGVVEGIEVPGSRFVVGVQWHPEALLASVPAQLGIYRAFVESAREGRP